jgi:hypothetical protein
VRALLIDLGVKETQGTLVELQTKLNEVLVNQAATGKRLIVVIDEAQNLDDTVLEAVRMLSNFETARQKLMQIILAGQLQLTEKLALPRLLQLRQRISIFAHLDPLTPAETASYIQHRLRVAGYTSDEPIFTPAALTLIARESQGIPRNINNICFNSLTLGCALQRNTIDVEMVREVLADLDIDLPVNPAQNSPHRSADSVRPASARTTNRPALSKVRMVGIPVAVCGIAALFGWLLWQDYRALSAENTVTANSSVTAPAPITQVDHRVAAPTGATAIVPAAAPMGPAQAQAPFSRPGNSIRFVPVREGQSLYAICAETFGECRPEVFKEIIRINPSISDPNHIVSGQKVAIPVLPSASVENK